MKYLETMVTFSEVPDEVTLCINITNCPCHCEGCHSPHLAEDIGTPLNWGSLNALIHINKGISCVAFMGGDSSPKEVNNLAYNVKRLGLKTAWYSGRKEISSEIDIRNFDYIKIGPYIKERGPLNSPTTNQIMYKVLHFTGECSFELNNITNKFIKNENKDKG